MASGIGATNPSDGGIAGGTILPARFVKHDTVLGQYLAASTSDRMIGISFRSARRSDMQDTSDPIPHANSGEPMGFYLPGARCKLELGGTVSKGNRIKSGSAGVGTAATTDHDQYGAIAEQDGVSGDFIWVLVVYGEASF